MSNNDTLPDNMYSESAEIALIGSVMIDGSLYHRVSHIHHGDFWLLRHGIIWRVIQSLANRQMAIDIASVGGEFTEDTYNEIGGAHYLTHLVSHGYDPANVETYARQVKQRAAQRQAAAKADEIRNMALGGATEDELRAAFSGASIALDDGNTGAVDFADALDAHLDRVERLYSNPETLPGLATGLKAIDDKLNGLQRTDLDIIAARPGMGKTSLMLTTALHQATHGYYVGLASLEMSSEQLIQRLNSIDSRVPLHKIRNPQLLNEAEWKRVVDSAGRLSEAAPFIQIYDNPRMTPSNLRSQAYQWRDASGLNVLYVDYLQLMDADTKSDSRVTDVASISRSLKTLARELDIPVVALSQLNRGVEQRQDKRPLLSDLRESGSIEQDADVVMLLYRDEYYNDATEFPDQADVIIAKHRNGATGTASLYWDAQFATFADGITRQVDLGG